MARRNQQRGGGRTTVSLDDTVRKVAVSSLQYATKVPEAITAATPVPRLDGVTVGGLPLHGGINVGSLTDALASGAVTVEALPPIRVVRENGNWYALDNAMLKACKDSLVREVLVRVYSVDDATVAAEFTNHRQAKPAQPLPPTSPQLQPGGNRDDQFDSGAYKFIQMVLQWGVGDLHPDRSKVDVRQHRGKFPDRPLSSWQPDGAGRSDVVISEVVRAAFYDKFLPLILEETRATLYKGLTEAKAENRFTTELHLTSRARKAHNPSKLSFDCPSPDLYAAGISVGDTFLCESLGASFIQFLATTSYVDLKHGRPKDVQVKAILGANEAHPDDGPDQSVLGPGKNWQLTYLGNVVPYTRMYDVCVGKPVTVFDTQLIVGDLSQPTTFRPSAQPGAPPSPPPPPPAGPMGAPFSDDSDVRDLFGIDPEPSATNRLENTSSSTPRARKSVSTRRLIKATVGASTAPASRTQPTTSRPDGGASSRLTAPSEPEAEAGTGPGQSAQTATVASPPLAAPEIRTVPAASPTASEAAALPNTRPAGALNAEQQNAVEDFLRTDAGIKLVQGPPGTGKTKTITVLLQALARKNERTMVCAPSNKAVQVLAERFLNTHPDVPIVLAGVDDKLPDGSPLRAIFLHTIGDQIKNLSDQILLDVTALADPDDTSVDRASLSARVAAAQAKIFEILDRYRVDLRLDPDVQRRLRVPADVEALTGMHWQAATARALLSRLWRDVFHFQERLKIMVEDHEPSGLEGQILTNSLFVFCTLSVSGRSLIRSVASITKFTTVIVDEAGQSIEPETLIPLRCLPNRLLLIGDTKQLPATVISETNLTLKLDRSLMSRLLDDCQQPHHILLVQHRMHPHIRMWPSSQFYGGRLTDHPSITAETHKVPAVQGMHPHLRPCAFFNVEGTSRPGQFPSRSLENPEEANFVQDLLLYYEKVGVDVVAQVGIITFYKGQQLLLSRQLEPDFPGVRVKTVDGFQGGEEDIIIISCVRAGTDTIGFLHDFRRLNVAITRARYALHIVGHAATLQRGSENHDIGQLVRHYRGNGNLHEASAVAAQLRRTPRAGNQMPIAVNTSQARGSGGNSGGGGGNNNGGGRRQGGDGPQTVLRVDHRGDFPTLSASTRAARSSSLPVLELTTRMAATGL